MVKNLPHNLIEIGLAKPDPKIYLEATDRLGVDAADTWFVGDGMHEELSVRSLRVSARSELFGF